MVVEYTPTQTPSAPAQVAPWQPEPPPRLTQCPRCSGRLYSGYDDEHKCVQCGFADYSRTPVGLGRPATNIVSSATRFVLRYVGDFTTLSETLAQARVVRLRNRAVYALRCPFCDEEMERSSLSGKRPDIREERFKCEEGHRVSLIPTKSGNLGWK